MHSECMDEMVKRVKEMRRTRSRELEREGRHASYGDHGEMRGYFNVLSLICNNPIED